MTHFMTQPHFVDMLPGAEDVKVLARAFEYAGYEVRVVGGAVRDLLKGMKPKDVDLTTNATPDQMMELAEKNGMVVVPTGLQHGTVSFILNHVAYEVTTLRVDTETDGRHAEVAWTTSFEADAARRDLTINAMSMDMSGRLYDYFTGDEDLRNGRIRFVGDADQRMTEDELRSLRFFRFYARYVNKDPLSALDSDTLNALKKHAPGLKRVSGERIWMEMSKILSTRHEDVLTLMNELGYLEALGFDHPNTDVASQRISFESTNPVTRLAKLANDPKTAEAVAKAWKLSNDERDMLRYLAQARKVDRDADVVFSLTSGMVEMTNGVPRNWVVERAREWGVRSAWVAAAMLETVDVPVFPVTGQDLLDRGVPQGKDLGEKLKSLKKAWQDSKFTLTHIDLMNKLGFLW